MVYNNNRCNIIGSLLNHRKQEYFLFYFHIQWFDLNNVNGNACVYHWHNKYYSNKQFRNTFISSTELKKKQKNQKNWHNKIKFETTFSMFPKVKKNNTKTIDVLYTSEATTLFAFLFHYDRPNQRDKRQHTNKNYTKCNIFFIWI